jgi:hypothetical protein
VDALKTLFIPCKKIKASEYTVAGWNDVISDKHDAARIAFLDWVSVENLDLVMPVKL